MTDKQKQMILEALLFISTSDILYNVRNEDSNFLELAKELKQEYGLSLDKNRINIDTSIPLDKPDFVEKVLSVFPEIEVTSNNDSYEHNLDLAVTDVNNSHLYMRLSEILEQHHDDNLTSNAARETIIHQFLEEVKK